jgi:hypothetical protein
MKRTEVFESEEKSTQSEAPSSSSSAHPLANHTHPKVFKEKKPS